jgi:hypothetical protein
MPHLKNQLFIHSHKKIKHFNYNHKTKIQQLKQRNRKQVTLTEEENGEGRDLWRDEGEKLKRVREMEAE